MNNPSSKLSQHWDAILTYIAGWLVIVTISTVQIQFAAHYSWTDAIKDAVVHWGPWLMLIPGIFFLVKFYSFQKGQRVQSVLVHLFSSLVTIFIAETISNELLRPALRLDQPRPNQSVFFNAPPGPPGPPPPRRDSDPNRPPPPHVRPGPPATSPALPKTLGKTISGAQQWLPVYWALVILRCLILTARGLREREKLALKLKSQLVESRLDTLKLQLQPHFLFNTLNAIAELVHRQPTQADDMICQLSTLLRAVLDERDAQEVPLSRELELLRAYLAIESVRFGNRLSVQENIDPVCLQAFLPVLLLQPIVENAVRHGIEPLDRTGTIWIRISQTDHHLKIVIADNGRGRQSTDASTGWGVGLRNAEARLAALYQEGGYSLASGDREGGGTVITVSLPFNSEPAESKDTEFWERQP